MKIDPYAKGYCWICAQQQLRQKNSNQLKAKSCSGRSGNNSGRGNGGCGTCCGGDGVDVSSKKKQWQ
jgi:hypothetical protein